MKISLINNKKPNFLINKQNHIFTKTLDKKDEFVPSCVSFSGNDENESSFQDDLFQFLTMIGDNPQRYVLKRSIYERTSIQDFCEHFTSIMPHSREVAELFKQKGFSKASQLFSLGNVYKHKSVQNAFACQEENFLEVYSLLNNKSYLSSFPFLLSHVYNEEAAKENPDFSKLERYPAFLSEISIKSDAQIYDCFSVLKSGFNDLKTVSDVVDLLDYLLETHTKKMQLLDQMLKSKPETAKYEPSYVYALISDAVDLHFLLNKGESLEPMQDYISVAVQMPSLKQNNVGIISETFNDFEDITDFIDFFKFLAISEISAKEFNSINSKSPVENFDLVTSVENLKLLTPVISQLCGINPQEARLLYLKNSDLINAVYDDKNPDTSALKLLLTSMKAFDIKDSSSFLSLHNRVFSSKDKTLSSSKIIELADLLSYSTKEELKSAKKFNMSEFQLLTKNKEVYSQVEDSIRQFIQDDTSDFFAGMTPLDVFHRYKSSFVNPSENINDILSNIVDLNISTSQEYVQKSKQIKQFQPFFEDRNSLFSFMADNQIDFSTSKESVAYKTNCLKILSSLFDSDNKDESFELINKLSKSKFLQKSGSSLSEFLSLFDDDLSLKNAMLVIINKKIPSTTALDSFYKKFKTKDSKLVDMINHISTFPDKINFNVYEKIISSSQKMLNDLHIPFSLSLDNMSNVSPQDYLSLSESTMPKFLNKLVNLDENKPFVLSFNTKSSSQTTQYTRFKIAYELVKHLDSEDKCYETLLRKMRLDKNYLFGNQEVNEKTFIDTVARYFPSELYDFINSDDFFDKEKYTHSTPDLTLHTKLRAISRFIVPELNSIEEICNPVYKQKLKDILSIVFENDPVSIQKGNNDNTYKLVYPYKGRHLHAIFTRSGKMSTIYLR